jgi:hypothetical protein
MIILIAAAISAMPVMYTVIDHPGAIPAILSAAIKCIKPKTPIGMANKYFPNPMILFIM